MRNAPAVALAAMLASTPFALAQSNMHLTGADFLSVCTRADADWVSFCNGYVQATFDGLRRPGEDFCPPADIKRTTVIENVVRQLQAIPALQAAPAASVVYAYLGVAFPCR
jgi:hypothetical protein